MKITQLRNATLIVHTGDRHILVDTMLAPQGALPPLRLLDDKRLRNPTVDLPVQAEVALDRVTHCLITHCQKGHFDDLDGIGKQWLRDRQIPVICTPHDAAYLRKRGLNVQPLPDCHDQPQPFFEGRIRTVRCTHGEGVISHCPVTRNELLAAGRRAGVSQRLVVPADGQTMELQRRPL